MKSANGHLTDLQRVLIVDNDSLLGAEVGQLLSMRRCYQVIIVSPEDEIDLLRDVWRLSPDVVILNNQSRVTNPIRLLSHLKDFGSFRLLVVGEDDNMIEVYEKRRIMAQEGSELTAAIQVS